MGSTIKEIEPFAPAITIVMTVAVIMTIAVKIIIVMTMYVVAKNIVVAKVIVDAILNVHLIAFPVLLQDRRKHETKI